jgi:hypothetical protein
MAIRDSPDALEEIGEVTQLCEPSEVGGVVQPNINQLLDARRLQ